VGRPLLDQAQEYDAESADATGSSRAVACIAMLPGDRVRVGVDGIAEGMANRVGALAPACLGLTLSFMREGLAFTWVATSVDVASLDAVQYLSNGPCVESMGQGAIVAMRDQFVTDQAVGMIMAAHRVGDDTASQRLHEAAQRAGIHDAELARILVKTRLL
jgi:hypothetical protein